MSSRDRWRVGAHCTQDGGLPVLRHRVGGSNLVGRWLHVVFEVVVVASVVGASTVVAATTTLRLGAEVGEDAVLADATADVARSMYTASTTVVRREGRVARTRNAHPHKTTKATQSEAHTIASRDRFGCVCADSTIASARCGEGAVAVAICATAAAGVKRIVPLVAALDAHIDGAMVVVGGSMASIGRCIRSWTGGIGCRRRPPCCGGEVFGSLKVVCRCGSTASEMERRSEGRR